MTDERLARLLALTPRAERFRPELARRMSSSPPDESEAYCIDHLAEDFALICVLFFQESPSTTQPVSSLANDLFAGAIVVLEALQNSWQKPGRATREQIACIDTVIDLLSSVGARWDEWRGTVQSELVAAYLLCVALNNERERRPLLGGVREEIFLRDALYSSLLTARRLREVVGKVRLRFFEHE